MKPREFMFFCVLVCLTWSLNGYAETSKDSYSGQQTKPVAALSAAPDIVVKDARFEFDSVLEDTVITHDFIILNSGDAPLVIEKVKTSCGCTTADYTREMMPGAGGKISIKAKTSGYAGRRFSKTVTVLTNDPNHREVVLYISGKVDPFALIEPRRIVLQGVPGQESQAMATITPLKKYPFHIVGTYAEGLDDKASFSVNKENNTYLLSVRNLMKTEGTYRGKIHLRTDSAVRPEIGIYVFAVIRKDHT